MKLKRQGTQLMSELQTRTPLSRENDEHRKDTTTGPKETRGRRKYLHTILCGWTQCQLPPHNFLYKQSKLQMEVLVISEMLDCTAPKNNALTQGKVCTELRHLYSCLLEDLHMQKPSLLIRAPCQGLCPKPGLLRTESNSIQLMKMALQKYNLNLRMTAQGYWEISANAYYKSKGPLS